MNDQKCLVGCFLKLKRKTFWVVRWLEITGDGVLTYRERKEDRQNKGEYKLTNCKIHEITMAQGQVIEIADRGGDKLKLMAHTQQEHKMICNAIQSLKVKPQESSNKQSIDETQIKQRPTIANNSIFTQKPHQFQVDSDLMKYAINDTLKYRCNDILKHQREQKQVLISVVDNVWMHRTHKENKIVKQQRNQLIDGFKEEQMNLGLPLLTAIGIIFFLLLSILMYLLLQLVDVQTYFYSTLISINIVMLPLGIKYFRKNTTVLPIVYDAICKTVLNVDYNGLAYIITQHDCRLKWYPNVLNIAYDSEQLWTITYSSGIVEQFKQSVYWDDNQIFIVEHDKQTIKRIYQIKWMNDEDRVELQTYGELQIPQDGNIQQQLISLKSYIKQQQQNPKSKLLEYLDIRATKQDEQVSSMIIFPEVLQSQQPYQTQSPPSQQQSIMQESTELPIQQQSILQQSEIIQQIPQANPELMKYHQILQEGKKYLESVYPISDEWKLQGDSNGFQIHTRVDPVSGQTMSRGEGIVPYSVKEMFDIIELVEKRGDYDSLFDSGYMVKKLDADTAVIYQKFKTIKIVVKSRDFVFLSRVFKEQDCLIIVAKSVEYNDIPPIKSSVRGDLKLAGWILRKLDDNKTLACFITMVDPKGNIPQAIVASSAKEQGQCVERVKQLLDRRNNRR